MITVKDLAAEYGMTEYKVRRILRSNNVRKEHYQWKWRRNSKGLQEAKRVLDKYQDLAN